MRGFIIKSISGFFYVLSDDDNKIYKCNVRGKIRNINITPICGDEVEFEHDAESDFSSILNVYPRKNSLVRPPIANVDIALIVMSTIKPTFDSYLVDKLIVQSRKEDIEPIIVLSKCEFITEDIQTLLDNYKLAGYKVFEVSSHQNINIDVLLEYIKGKRCVMCGQSAVGKSSLINSLNSNLHRDIGDFSEKLGRGKHTTREVELIDIGGAYVADSPGFSSLDIKIELVDFARAFKDFEVLANKCKYSTCLHDNEPGCAIKKAVEDGIRDIRRYNNYLHLKSEIKDGKHVWVKK